MHMPHIDENVYTTGGSIALHRYNSYHSFVFKPLSNVWEITKHFSGPEDKSTRFTWQRQNGICIQLDNLVGSFKGFLFFCTMNSSKYTVFKW